MFEKNFPKDKQRERNASDENGHRVGFIQVLQEKARVFPEASMRAVKTEELWQLCAGKKKCHAGFEAGHDTF